MKAVEPGERLKAPASYLEVAYAGEDVDDRLGLEAGNRGAADMVDAAHDPFADRLFEQRALLLESSRPAWIGRRELDGSVAGVRVRHATKNAPCEWPQPLSRWSRRSG
ncbi:MAG TPA: hypothetical protein VGN84_03470 [Solirubrobacterales bacterium]|nr:hypothetical protein [Solirubrobacterales bacterium]